MSDINKALARVTSSLEMQFVIEQTAFSNRVEDLFFLEGDRYVALKWETISHHRGAKHHITRLKAEVENSNLYVRLGAGYAKTDAFALVKRKRTSGKGSTFSIRS